MTIGRPPRSHTVATRLRRLAPRLHVSGHIHEGHGSRWRGRTLCVNASICDLDYRPVQPPIVVDL